MPALHTWRALVLILLSAAGLFTMHTIGHLGPHHAIPLAASPHYAHSHKTAQAPEAAPAPHDPGFPIGPLMVCVAILLALVTLVFGLALPARLDLRGLSRKLAHIGLFASTRGPPALRIGLRIADLSVLRT